MHKTISLVVAGFITIYYARLDTLFRSVVERCITFSQTIYYVQSLDDLLRSVVCTIYCVQFDDLLRSVVCTNYCVQLDDLLRSVVG